MLALVEEAISVPGSVTYGLPIWTLLSNDLKSSAKKVLGNVATGKCLINFGELWIVVGAEKVESVLHLLQKLECKSFTSIPCAKVATGHCPLR